MIVCVCCTRAILVDWHKLAVWWMDPDRTGESGHRPSSSAPVAGGNYSKARNVRHNGHRDLLEGLVGVRNVIMFSELDISLTGWDFASTVININITRWFRCFCARKWKELFAEAVRKPETWSKDANVNFACEIPDLNEQRRTSSGSLVSYSDVLRTVPEWNILLIHSFLTDFLRTFIRKNCFITDNLSKTD